MDDIYFAPCPNCGTNEEVYVGLNEGNLNYCHCDNCGLSSESAYSPDVAIHFWNAGIYEMTHHEENDEE